MLDDMPLVLFDLETTGLDQVKDRIVEYAFAAPDGSWEMRGLVDPGIAIPPEATEVHGIRDEDVADAPRFRDVASEIWDHIRGHFLAGFNSRSFDPPFLGLAFHRAGMKEEARELLAQPEIDLYRVWQALEPRSLLGALRRFSPLDESDYAGLHRAAFDTKVLPDIFRGMVEELGCDDAGVWLELSCPRDEVDRDGKFKRREDGAVVFNFGQHKGEPVDTPAGRDYLEWMLTKDFGPEVRKICKRILKGEKV